MNSANGRALADLQSQLQVLEDAKRRLELENEGLRRELEETKRERNAYQRHLKMHLPIIDDPELTPEIVEDVIKNGVTWETIQRDLKALEQ